MADMAEVHRLDQGLLAKDEGLRIAIKNVEKMEGPKGAKGETGLRGAVGAKGDTGSQGQKGETGDDSPVKGCPTATFGGGSTLCYVYATHHGGGSGTCDQAGSCYFTCSDGQWSGRNTCHGGF